MKVLAYTSSLNGKRALLQCMRSLRAQTYPVREILVVDNRSSDGTCLEPLGDNVTLIGHLRNLGTSGAAATAFQYAIQEGYEWVWVLDQDTIPSPDALETLVNYYQSLSSRDKARVAVLNSVMLLHPIGIPIHGRWLTPGGVRPVRVAPADGAYECDATIWSGSMFKLSVVEAVGPPRFGADGCWQDLALDYGDLEYTYRIKARGYRVVSHNMSRLMHPVGDARYVRVAGHLLFSTNHSAFRRYLYFRNMLFFWLQIYPRRRSITFWLFFAFRLGSNCAKLMLLERDRLQKIRASLAGVWDGVRGDTERHRSF